MRGTAVAGMQAASCSKGRFTLAVHHLLRELNSFGLLGFSRSECKVLSMFQQKTAALYSLVLNRRTVATWSQSLSSKPTPNVVPWLKLENVNVTAGAMRIRALSTYLHCLHFDSS